MSAESTASAPSAWNGAYVLITLLVVAAPWSTGIDAATETRSYALGKLALLAAAAASAWAKRPKGSLPVPAGLGCLLLYGCLTLVGAVFVPGGAITGSAIRSARWLLFCVLVAWLAPRLTLKSIQRAWVAMAVGLGGTAVLAAFLGLQEGPQGRLAGYLPPLHPNALGGVLGIGALMATFAWVRSERWRVPPALVAGGLAIALLATGSRTSMGALATGLLALVVLGGLRGRRGVALTWVVAVGAIGALLLVGPGGLVQTATRGGESQVDATFSGRTYAWARVLGAHDSLEEVVFGQGLAVKRIQVERQFVDEQPVDGTWASAYLEGGIAGTLLLATATILALARATRHPRPGRGLIASLLGFLLCQSLLESTLNEVTVSFVLFLVLLLLPTPLRTPPRATAPIFADSVGASAVNR